MYIHFSKTSKMPCPSWGIPTSMCVTGGILRKRIDRPYICRLCYACNGHIEMAEQEYHNLQRNYEAYVENPKLWIFCMSHKIKYEFNCQWFRWFHSGDLQSVQMLLDIIKVGKRCKHTKFWLPTMELRFVKEAQEVCKFPENVCVRISTPMINGRIREYPGATTSKVVSEATDKLCPAYLQGGKCLACRRCWDNGEKEVHYPLKVGRKYFPEATMKRLHLKGDSNDK